MFRTKTLLIAAILILSQLIISCGGNEPTFMETAPPESRIVVKTDHWDNCQSASPVNRTFETKNTRTQETAWWVEGKAGIGGSIPLGFLMPSLDIETSITNHYGSKETRTWQSTYTDIFDVPGNTHTVLAVYYQELTQKGVIRFYDKEIEYEYPAELSKLAHRKVDLTCDPLPVVQITCISVLGSTDPAPGFENIAGSWDISSPSDGEIVRLDIDVQDPNVIIHAYTDGSSGVADWGIQYQCLWSSPMTVKFEHLLFKSTTLTLHGVEGSKLHATAVDYYINTPVTIPPQTREYVFTR